MDDIISHGRQRDTTALVDLIENTETELLTEIIVQQVQATNFTIFFDFLLDGFNDTSQSHEKRFQSVYTMLKQIQAQGVTNAHLKNMIFRVCIELPKFKSEHLVRLCSLCLESIQKGDGADLNWKELFPVILDVIEERAIVEYNDEEMSGLQYKTQILSSLLMMEWSENIITPLTDMFATFTLTKEEHTQVVNKLVRYIDNLMPQEIPTFVYQLLRLCKSQNIRPIFLRLQNYFGTKIYSKTLLNSDSESMDSIGSASDVDAIQAESTVLYHIHESANGGCIKDYLNSLKNLIKSPEFVLHPFQLTVLLTISTLSTYEERVFEILKSSIFRCYNEEHKKNESCWFSEMVPKNDSVTSVFTKIISYSVENRDLVLQGLFNLSFILLGSPLILGKENIVEKLWNLGSFITVKLIKQKRYLTHTIIKRLSDDIISGHNVHQHTECLHTITKRYGGYMLENTSGIISLLDLLPEVPGPVASDILDAIIILTKVSHTIRDHLILLLRKCLNSRSLETRQMAVGGFLRLIRNLKFTNLGALSQSSNSSSGYSVLTQISLTQSGQAKSSTFSNESLCLEVLSILQRCFMQQADIKSKMYSGFYDAVCMNGDLGVPALEVMWTHFSTFYVREDELLPPINFSKLVQIKDTDAVLQEPMGKLLCAIASIIKKLQELDEDKPIVDRFVKIFDTLSEKMPKCEVEHFELDDGTDLLDILPESQEKILILKEALSIYEALIGYNITSWNLNSELNAEKILRLFEGYNRLIKFSKNLTKPKKGDKTKSPTKGTQNDTTSTKKEGASKRSFKYPDTILDFETIYKILSLLHNTSVKWTTSSEAVILKRNVDLHRYFLNATINLLQQLKQMKYFNSEKKNSYYKHCTNIATILYKRCISRHKELSEFDVTTANLSVEAFYVLLQVMNVLYEDRWVSFLSSITAVIKDDIDVHLTVFIETYQDLFSTLGDDTAQDAETVRFYQMTLNTLKLLGKKIPAASNSLGNKHLDWMKQYATDNKIKGRTLQISFLSNMFNLHVKFKSTTSYFATFAKKTRSVIGTVSEDTHQEPEDVEEIAFINEESGNTTLLCLCNEIKVMLDEIDWITLRLNAEYLMIMYPGEDSIERRREYLKSKERSICCQICQIVALMEIIGDISVHPGPYCEAIIKNNIHLYNSLTNLAKYFVMRSTKINVVFQTARFDSVVKQVGKKLSPVVYRLIPFIEQNQKKNDGKKKAKTDTLKSIVLKETRLIPKLIYEMEQFSKTVIQLSNKTKVDLSRYVGQGTSRDFRILDLMNVIEKDPDHTQADCTMDDSRTQEQNTSREDESEAESTQPPAKKSKK